jgi:hypothetical protein
LHQQQRPPAATDSCVYCVLCHGLLLLLLLLFWLGISAVEKKAKCCLNA